MSAELLREAVAAMREWPVPEHVGHAFWTALADWLEHAADGEEMFARFDAEHGREHRQQIGPFEVARAYLGEPAEGETAT